MIDEPVLDLRRLRVLQEVHRLGTVSAAAAALHLTPSAVSQQLTGLSRDLGVPLLDRVGRGVRLTGQAHVLLEHAAVVSEQLERAKADLALWSDGVVGQVRIGSLATGVAALVGPAITQLRQSHPEIDVRVWETEPPEAFELLETGEVEIVVAVDYRDAPLRSDPRYKRVDLLTDRMDVVLPTGHPLATEQAVAKGIRLERLAGEAWVSAEPTDPCSLIMTAVCAVAGFSPDVHHYCREWDAVAALVAAGAGVALVPRLAQPLRPANLVTCPVIGSPTSRLVFAVARAGVQSVPPALTVLATLQEIAAGRPDAVDQRAARPVSAR